jgi:riboflavin synthase
MTMFTGIITELGAIEELEVDEGLSRIAISGPTTSRGLARGDSVAVNGVCLTVVDIDGPVFHVEAVAETIQRTSLGSLVVGGPVNLERPMSAAGRFDGHIVQGHVDGVGTIVDLGPDGSSTRVRVTTPRALARYMVEKGSVCVDGVSLTITAVSDRNADPSWFEFVVIPHTLEVTVLGTKHVGDPVNLEVDVIAKYVERLLSGER